jgi:hypothetical protein
LENCPEKRNGDSESAGGDQGEPDTHMKPHLEAHCDGCRLPAQKMLWSMQTFRVTLDSRDYAALNPAYLYQGTAAH